MSYKSENLFKKRLYASSRFWETSMSSQLVLYNFCLNSSINSVSNTFKYDGSFCVICLFHRRWNNETYRKMIRYVTFKNSSFKDSVSERVCENMIYCGGRFLRNSTWFFYCWNHSISIDYIEKSLHFPICIMVK